MQSLGLFFGHIVKAAKQDVTPASKGGEARSEVRRQVHEEVAQGPGGPVILRRTVIEEIEVPAGQEMPARVSAGPGAGGAAPIEQPGPIDQAGPAGV